MTFTFYTDEMSKLVETLAAELERPRELSRRVLNYIGDTHNVDHDAIGSFLVHEMSKLEDDDIDLILSPIFTPKLSDQAVFAELLGRDSVPREKWPQLVKELESRPTHAALVTLDGVAHSVKLRDVTIERYVHRLRLEGTIPDSLFNLIERSPSTERPLFKAIARRAIWESAARRAILVRFLEKASGSLLHDALALLDLAESYKPADIPELLAWIPGRQKALTEQINAASGPKPFFSGRVEYMHGGERDQRQQDDTRISAKENELAFLGRLHEALN